MSENQLPTRREFLNFSTASLTGTALASLLLRDTPAQAAKVPKIGRAHV
mgnify:CR=1 FL=1